MSVAGKIEAGLEKAFAPHHIKVVNQSHQHEGHAGDDGSGESHFKVTLVSAAFTDKNRVERHRMVHAAISDELKTVHAFSLSALTPEEYEKKRIL